MIQQPTRRDFVKNTGLGVLALGLSGTGSRLHALTKRDKRPNILFICTDYQAGEDGPTLGNSFLDMPALKRLSDNGIVFERHYSTAPICMPARYTWVSGRYPHYHGLWDNWGGWFKPGTPILMEELTRAGYQTTGIGKMHFDPWDRMAGFQRRIIADRKGGLHIDDDYAKFLKSHGHDRNRLDYGPHVEWEIPEVYDWPFDESLHIDAYVGDQAVGVIERDELRGPWFLWVSFNGPHNPWNPPAKYTDPYKNMDLPPANSRRFELLEKPTDHTRVRYNYTRSVPDLIDQNPEQHDEIIKRIRAGHFGGLTFIDRQMEKILEALEEKKLLDETIIIFSSDHGCHLGDHESIHKGTHYHRSAHVPFVVHCPKRYRPRRTKAFSSHVDFMPTILKLASAPMPDSLEGKDLTPILNDENESVQDHVFIEIRHTVSVITDRWKLGIHLKDHDGDLYDLHRDPQEQHNLFYLPGYEGVRSDLLEKIFAFHPEFKDQLENNPYEPFIERDEYQLPPGEILKDIDAPYQADKNIHVHAVIEMDGAKKPEGPIVVSDVVWAHGYAIYMHKGKLEAGIRRWGKNHVFPAVDVPEGKATIDFTYGRDGTVKLLINGNPLLKQKVAGGIPAQTGRKRALTGMISAGKVHGWHRPLGNYKRNSEFSGKIFEAVVKLDRSDS